LKNRNPFIVDHLRIWRNRIRFSRGISALFGANARTDS
jgi:hypothetical protein